MVHYKNLINTFPSSYKIEIIPEIVNCKLKQKYTGLCDLTSPNKTNLILRLKRSQKLMFLHQ